MLLSALEACGVDNARIEVEGGGELPLWDGNAVGWAEEIQLAGLQLAPTLDGTMAGPREPLAPHKVSLPESTHEVDLRHSFAFLSGQLGSHCCIQLPNKLPLPQCRALEKGLTRAGGCMCRSLRCKKGTPF